MRVPLIVIVSPLLVGVDRDGHLGALGQVFHRREVLVESQELRHSRFGLASVKVGVCVAAVEVDQFDSVSDYAVFLVPHDFHVLVAVLGVGVEVVVVVVVRDDHVVHAVVTPEFLVEQVEGAGVAAFMGGRDPTAFALVLVEAERELVAALAALGAQEAVEGPEGTVRCHADEVQHVVHSHAVWSVDVTTVRDFTQDFQGEGFASADQG